MVPPNANLYIRPNLSLIVNIDNPTRPASLQRGQDDLPNPQLNPTQFAEEIWQESGLYRGNVRHVYKKSYPEWVDNQPFTKGFEIPDFAIFTGEDEQSTIEHIDWFLTQCGEVGTND